MELQDLIASASEIDEPRFPPPTSPRLGGVDPLGLRQINFDLMDQVLPGLNNVGRRLRPYVVVAWACRRAVQLAKDLEQDDVRVDDVRGFVDRTEIIYAWSQFLLNPNADLPGRQVLAPLLGRPSYTFGGEAWRRWRDDRRFSTALTAPINYGPALKTLGWVAPHHKHRDVLIALPQVDPALDAFEALIEDRLDHPAFSELGPVTVTAEDVMSWAEAWKLGEATEAEQSVTAALLFGETARAERRAGGALMLEAVRNAADKDVSIIRKAMAGVPSNFSPPEEITGSLEAWRRVQVRQLFRLGLESLFYWIGLRLQDGPKSTEALIEAFLEETGGAEQLTGAWLKDRLQMGVGPTDLIEALQAALDEDEDEALGSVIAGALAFAIAEAPVEAQPFERPDRLPVCRAGREAAAFQERPVRDFIRHAIEVWVLAQHVYWSVGRGLADARARGKQILRLKIVLEEQGWELAPGVYAPSTPQPTPDRLQTALTLAEECGLLPL